MTNNAPMTAGVLLGIIFTATATAAWLSVGAIPGRSNGGGLVLTADGLAVVPCVIAAVEAIRLARGKTSTASAIGWFFAALFFLLVVLFMAAVSNSGLGD